VVHEALVPVPEAVQYSGADSRKDAKLQARFSQVTKCSVGDAEKLPVVSGSGLVPHCEVGKTLGIGT